MGEPAYKLEQRDHGWLVYINEDLDEGELSEVLDYVTLQAIRKRSGLSERDAEMLAAEVKQAAWERVRDRVEKVRSARA